MSEIRNEYFPLKDETDTIIHFGFEVHKILGFGFLEIVYKDALEYEFIKMILYLQGRKNMLFNIKIRY